MLQFRKAILPSDWRITTIFSNNAHDGQIKAAVLPKSAAVPETLNPLFQITEDVGSSDGNRYVFFINEFLSYKNYCSIALLKTML